MLKRDHESVPSREIYGKLLFFWIAIQESGGDTGAAVSKFYSQEKRAGFRVEERKDKLGV